MSKTRRKNNRFSVDVPAVLVRSHGHSRPVNVQQISIGGCLAAPASEVYVGDEFRLEIELPNGNRVPMMCKAVYQFDEAGIGARFVHLTAFQRELIEEIIIDSLEADGLPLPPDAFEQAEESQDTGADHPRPKREEILDNILATDKDALK